jgi:IS1 family transposase/transposase-like protein
MAKMEENERKSIKVVGGFLYCNECKAKCIKWGKTKTGSQRFRCSICGLTRMESYKNKAYKTDINLRIVSLLKEGCGISSIARLLGISPTTIQKRILAISKGITKPIVPLGKSYEMDELCTYIGSKKTRVWIAYAIRQDTKEVVDFRIGKRTNKTLRPVIQTLILSSAKKVFTDKLLNYRSMIPRNIHSVKNRGTNHIERKNLNLRTHLKCLARRTICFSKSLAMLNACVRIYFFESRQLSTR